MMTRKDEVDLARGVAKRHGLDPDFVCAIIQVESDWNTWAVRHEPLYKHLFHPRVCADKFGIPSVNTETFLQMTSFGLMQVMGAVAREAGFDGWLTELCNPEYGLEYGCKHLKKKIVLYGGDEMKAAAAYNAGSARYLESGAHFVNQAYCNKVNHKLLELRRLS
jgi:soluble lytic murein transglycosylase-like protein